MRKLHTWIIDDEAPFRKELRDHLLFHGPKQNFGFHIHEIDGIATLKTRMEEVDAKQMNPPELVFVDNYLTSDKPDGFDKILPALRTTFGPIPLIAITSKSSETDARVGAWPHILGAAFIHKK